MALVAAACGVAVASAVTGCSAGGQVATAGPVEMGGAAAEEASSSSAADLAPGSSTADTPPGTDGSPASGAATASDAASVAPGASGPARTQPTTGAQATPGDASATSVPVVRPTPRRSASPTASSRIASSAAAAASVAARSSASKVSVSRSVAAARSSAAMLASAGEASGGASPGPSATGAALLLGAGTESVAEAEVVRLVNAQRTAAGCAAVAVDPILVRLARAHSDDMAGAAGFKHNGSDGRTPFQRMTAAGYDYSVAAENIAAGQPNAGAVMAAWMASPGHEANIVDCRFTQIGVGVVNRPGTPYVVYWTQEFAAPM